MEHQIEALTQLPHQPFDRRTLPEVAGVYLVYDASGTVLYIGESGNMKGRWRQEHHRRKEIDELSELMVAWVLEADPVVRKQVERAYIQHYAPVLNGTAVPSEYSHVAVEAEYLTPRQVGLRLGVTARRISLLCTEERFPGAYRTEEGKGGRWIIPVESVAAFIADARNEERVGPAITALRQ